ncbi:MAG: hypothetical protein A4E73_01768 [Syntrophaceae bacterium PtaU1.Bin231]|nr:MAG: hypothetical protein A4E73_01768 [Syntrophaceae bacterium PtaU1.Bin231]
MGGGAAPLGGRRCGGGAGARRDAGLLRHDSQLGLQPAADEIQGYPAGAVESGGRPGAGEVDPARRAGQAHLSRVRLLRDRAAGIQRGHAFGNGTDPPPRIRAGQQRHERGGHRQHRYPGGDPLSGPRDRGCEGPAGADQVHQQAARERRRQALPPGRHDHHGGGAGSRCSAHAAGQRHLPEQTQRADAFAVLHGKPRRPPSPRRQDPLDQRRHAPPVDHAGPRFDAPQDGRECRERPGHVVRFHEQLCGDPVLCRPPELLGAGRDERSRSRGADLLLHQPAEREAPLLPRPCLGHHAAQRLCGHGGWIPDHRREGGGPHQCGDHPRQRHAADLPLRHPPGHPGQDLCRRGDDHRRDRHRSHVELGNGTEERHDRPDHRGGDGRSLVAPRLHAGPESLQPRLQRRESHGPLGLRPLVLAADASVRISSRRDQTFLYRVRRGAEPPVRDGSGAAPGDARNAEPILGRRGVPGYAGRQRCRLSDRHRAASAVPLPDPERRP